MRRRTGEAPWSRKAIWLNRQEPENITANFLENLVGGLDRFQRISASHAFDFRCVIRLR
jgi:hypothetical protein